MSETPKPNDITKEVEEEFEVERIIDFVSFIDAHEQYFKNNDYRYKNLFKDEKLFKTKKTFTICKYFFLVKWLNFPRQEMTWEPEENVPAAVYLPEFKKVNNLPQSLIRLRLNIASDRNAYVKPNVLKEVQERCAKVTNEHMNTFTVTLNDEVNNGKFGIIPLPLYKRKLIRGEEYLKKGDEMYWLKQVVVESPNATTSAKFVENHEKIDRSFLQMMIRNDNIVCIRDGYITSENERKATISFVHDWCHQTLREKMTQEGKVDWKNVCKDILKALSYIHTNGIHQAVSIDSIYYNTDGNYQLSNFKNFTFTQQLQHNEVKSEGIELAPRKYGLSAPFDATLDLYALAIVLLQCQKKSLIFRRKPNSVIEIEEDIEKAMNNLETDEERRFIRMMLRARMHMHNVLAVYRYTADGFLEHPLLSTEKMKSVECLYVHHMLGIPVKEYVYYEPNDTVYDVISRHLSLYHGPKNDKVRYLLISSDDFSALRKTTILLGDGEIFADVVNKDVIADKKQLLMFPIISKEADRIADEDVENCRKVIIHYDQELGGCPIVMKIANKDEEDLLKAIKQRVISADLRHDHSVQLFRRDSENTSNDLPKYVDEHYVMKLSRDDGKEVEFKKRFVITEEMESELKGDLLKWNDVAGGDGRMEVLSRKRTRDNDQNPDEVAECQLKTVKVES